MVRRFVALHFAALHVVLLCSGSFADTPLVIAELDAKQASAEADSARTRVEHELAAWKLTQLKELRSHGHASWQEVARQEVTVRSAAAAAEASQRYLGSLLEWQSRVAKLNLRHISKESECVRLYMPGSARLVAWVPAETASRALLERHLNNLHREYQSVSGIDLSSLESAMKKAEHAVELYSRSEKDADLGRLAKIRLRLAEAEYESAKTRKESSSIIARRIALVSESLKQTDGDQPSPSIARPGTRLVDATSDPELARLVEAMARDETIASEQIAWLKHRRDAVLDRIDALQELSEYHRGDQAELDRGKTEETELQLQIGQAQEVFKVQQQIASEYETALKPPSTSIVEQAKSIVLDDDVWPADANAVRHWLELEQLMLRTAASSAAMEAQRDYLFERLNRVQRIPEKARPPKELDHLRDQVQGAEQQLKMIDRQLMLLRCEQDRFGYQLESQRGDPFQLVQVGNGTFLRREQFEVGEALIAAVGFVGLSGIFPRTSIRYPYIESTIMLDCMATLSIRSPEPASQIHNLCASSGGYGLRLATDGITYPQDRFCYVPYGLWPVHRDCGWAPCDYLHPASRRGFRSFDWLDREATGLSRLNSFYWRSRCPTFPYRNSYLFQTAFPSRSLLYSNPNVLPVSAYKGFRH